MEISDWKMAAGAEIAASSNCPLERKSDGVPSVIAQKYQHKKINSVVTGPWCPLVHWQSFVW